mmetsp:Transcript_6443/g.17404  ORF Transcript_6443/g.17404 Transcript_6443/m.17404 type:complete len:396 (-) Transcript_6443:116-1303(-)
MQGAQPRPQAHVEYKLESELEDDDYEKQLLRDPTGHAEGLDDDVVDEEVLDGEDELQDVADEPVHGRIPAQAHVDHAVVEHRQGDPDQQGGAVEEPLRGPVPEEAVDHEEGGQGQEQEAPVEEGHGLPHGDVLLEGLAVPAGPDEVVPDLAEFAGDGLVELLLAGQPVLPRDLADNLRVHRLLHAGPDGLLDGLVIELVLNGGVGFVLLDSLLELLLLLSLLPVLLAVQRLGAALGDRLVGQRLLLLPDDDVLERRVADALRHGDVGVAALVGGGSCIAREDGIVHLRSNRGFGDDLLHFLRRLLHNLLYSMGHVLPAVTCQRSRWGRRIISVRFWKPLQSQRCPHLHEPQAVLLPLQPSAAGAVGEASGGRQRAHEGHEQTRQHRARAHRGSWG